MDLQRVDEFLVICRHGNLKKAAEELKLSPTTLASRMNAFEKSLNISLFEHDQRKMKLTPAGERFLVNAQEISHSCHVLTEDMNSISRNHFNRMRIGIVGRNMPYHLGPFLDQLNLKQPDMKLDLLDGDDYSIPESLISGELDLFFSPALSEHQYEGIHKVSIAGAHQYVILPNFHPLAAHASISMEELDGETFLLYPKTKAGMIRDFQLKNLEASGIRFQHYDTASSPEKLRFLIPIGKGISLTPFYDTETAPNTALIPLENLSFGAQQCLFYSKTPMNPDINGFVKEFLAFAGRGAK